MRQIKITDFLNESEIKKCFELKKAKLICDQVISPIINRINYDLGQDNDPMYLSYVCEYLVSMFENKEVK